MSKEILFEELQPSVANIITESSSDGKELWLNGVFMQAEVQNRNKRVYPIHEVSAAVDSLNKQISETNGVMGELDHPSTISLNLDRVSHVIKEMRMEGNNAIGRAIILDTPMGNIARSLIKSGVQLGVSSRGTGSVNEGVVASFNVVTIDIVAQPSAQGATPHSIYESLDNNLGRKVETLSEAMQKDPNAQKYFAKEFERWIKQSFNR